jgi:hypothetical protein
MIDLSYWPTPNGHKITLFLVHGLMDDNVPPQNTLQVVDALVKANKDFDLLLLPHARHGYGIADMACHPWIDPYDKAPLDLAPFAEVRRWHAAIAARPAAKRAYALSRTVNPRAGAPLSGEERRVLFGQAAR